MDYLPAALKRRFLRLTTTAFTSLGGEALTEYQRTANPKTLDTAVKALRKAAELTPLGHPDLPGRLSDLGAMLLTRFELAGDVADLNAAINAGQRAVDLTPAGHPDLSAYLSNLGRALSARYELTGNSADLDAAINAAQEAVASAPPDAPTLHAQLSILGSALLLRFSRDGNSADLDAAINAAQRAVDLAPSGNPYVAGYLSNLGGSLRLRYTLANNAADLDAAINAAQRAVDLATPGQPDLAKCLFTFGSSMLLRFELTGDAADLDAAINAAQRADKLMREDNPGLPVCLSSLGISLRRRYELSGDAADLDAAIGAGQRAVKLMREDNPGLPSCLSNLGGSLQARYQLAGDVTDLDAAIDAGRRSVRLASHGHPDLPAYLANLGVSLHAHFKRTADRADLDAAIGTAQRSVAAAADHPWFPDTLANLGSLQLSRFEVTGDAADLDEAIATGQQAVAMTAPGYVSFAINQVNLGNALGIRSRKAGNNADLDAAINCWRQASQATAATPRIRLVAARNWGAAAAIAGRTGEAAREYALAVGLLPEVAWHGLDRAAREEQLAQHAGLAADAAACAVLAGQARLAVELVEQGRSVLWAQALNMRTDLDRLTREHPDLARRLNSIRAILDATPRAELPLPAATPDGLDVLADTRQQRAAELRTRKAREWDETLAQVRALPGFRHFLTATPYPELAAAAVGGPVVIVNASSHGCHALIVHEASHEPDVVPLPGLSLDEAIQHANRMLDVLAQASDPQRTLREREQDRHAIQDVLDWLWHAIAEPVLSALGHTAPPEPGKPWPRVWWCATGPLTVLPLHAAVPHGRDGQANGVPDRVISSYTPTLAALARARHQDAPVPVRHLAVGMQSTPGLAPLPAVPAEMAILARHFPPGPGNRQLTGTDATRTAVTAAAASCTWLHLACHTIQYPADPDRSGFVLADGTLTIADLAAQPTRHRELAFLSACQTAAGSVRHLDEAIHPAAAAQFLGFRHVIATMWTVDDSPTAEIVDRAYADLVRGKDPGPERAAHALHHAVRELRHAHPDNPLLWAPYIHLGS